MPEAFNWREKSNLDRAMDEVASIKKRLAFAQKKVEDLQNEYDLAAARLKELL